MNSQKASITAPKERARAREPFFDNLRLMMMFFVVLCHGLERVRGTSENIVLLHEAILCFVMPTFVFITGYFSKGMADANSSKRTRILNFAILYAICQFLRLWLAPEKYTYFFKPSFGNWYLAAMVFWYLILPSVAKLKDKYVLIGAFILALFVGCEPKPSALLQWSRLICFFFYFYLGFCCPANVIEKLKDKKSRKWEALLLLGMVAFSVFFWSDHTPLHILHYDQGYAQMKLSIITGIIMRAGQYIVSILASIGIFAIVPRKELKITVYGRRTLPIYVIHLVIYLILATKTNFFSYIEDCRGTTLIFVVLSVVMILICGNKWFARVFDWFMGLSFQKTLKPDKIRHNR